MCRRVFATFCMFGVLLVGSLYGRATPPENPMVQLSLKKQKGAVENNVASYTIYWNPIAGVQLDHYTIQVTSDNDTLFSSPMRTETVASNSYSFELQGLELGKAYFLRVGYEIPESDEITGWSTVHRLTVGDEQLPVLELLKSVGAGDSDSFLNILLQAVPEMDWLTGKFILIVLAVHLLIGLSVFVRRWIQIRAESLSRKSIAKVVKQVQQRWYDARHDKAALKQLMDDLPENPGAVHNGQIGKGKREYRALVNKCILSIIRAGLSNHEGNLDLDDTKVSEEVDRDMQKQIDHQARKLSEQRMDWVSLIAEISPLIGLFGTVCGLLIAFFNLHETMLESYQPADLVQAITQGIYTAIMTTVFGLLLAIGFTYLSRYLDVVLVRTVDSWNEFYLNVSEKIQPKRGAKAVQQ